MKLRLFPLKGLKGWLLRKVAKYIRKKEYDNLGVILYTMTFIDKKIEENHVSAPHTFFHIAVHDACKKCKVLVPGGWYKYTFTIDFSELNFMLNRIGMACKGPTLDQIANLQQEEIFPKGIPGRRNSNQVA